MIKRTRKNRQSRDWAGRGLEAMNRMECFGEDAKHIFQKAFKEKKKPIVQIMLEELLKVRKQNKFYNSLLKQFKRSGDLTIKQMACVKKDHDRLIRGKKNINDKQKNEKLSDGNMDKTNSLCGDQ